RSRGSTYSAAIRPFPGLATSELRVILILRDVYIDATEVSRPLSVGRRRTSRRMAADPLTCPRCGAAVGVGGHPLARVARSIGDRLVRILAGLARLMLAFVSFAAV